MQTMKTSLVLLTCSLGLVACGLKGPLYLPEETAVPQKDVQQEPVAKESESKDTKQKKDNLSS